jgi:hypothetical protein
MTDTETDNAIWQKPDRKRELVAQLQRINQHHYEAADALDKKAMELLRYSSAFLAIVITISVSIAQTKNNGDDVSTYFIIGFLILLILYVAHVFYVLFVVTPMEFAHVPGVPTADNEVYYETMMLKYIRPETDDAYLDKLIVDYVGVQETVDGEGPFDGAIQINQKQIRRKADQVEQAKRLLSLMTVGAVFTILLNTDPQWLFFTAMLVSLVLTAVLIYQRQRMMDIGERLVGRIRKRFSKGANTI